MHGETLLSVSPAMQTGAVAEFNCSKPSKRKRAARATSPIKEQLSAKQEYGQQYHHHHRGEHRAEHRGDMVAGEFGGHFYGNHHFHQQQAYPYPYHHAGGLSGGLYSQQQLYERYHHHPHAPMGAQPDLDDYRASEDLYQHYQHG